MGFINRFQTLVRADAHGVVDALEDRGLVLRQHLRDAAAELDRKRQRLAGLAAEDSRLVAAEERVATAVAALDADVALALERGEDELARYAVRKLLPKRRATERLERRRRALGEERAALAERLAEQEAEHELLEEQVRGYLARAGDDAAVDPGVNDDRVTDEDVELELLRRREGGA